jgi:xanthine dehydrogenase accessory factor
MRQIAETVGEWAGSGGEVLVARVVSMEGLGGRRAGEAMAVSSGGERTGSLLGGAADATVDRLVGTDIAVERFDVEIGDADAVAAGLACGGSAGVLVQRASLVPPAVWGLLAGRTPLALATVLEVPGSSADPAVATGEVSFVTASGGGAATMGIGEWGALGDVVREAAESLIRNRRDDSLVVEHEGVRVLVESFVPATRLVVVGEGSLAAALATQCRVLGWECEISPQLAGALEAVDRLGPADALVVLTHDHGLDTPVLSAALRRRGYVGALGSRHTQSGRRDRLAALGLTDDELRRIHGPVGLDLGAKTPEETSLAICAEIVAWRSGRDGSSLSLGSGPING